MKSLSDVFKALGDPNRMAIIDLLRQRDMTPSELLEKLKIAQPTLSHHLDILKRAELVDAAREGQFIRYSLNMSVFEMMVQFTNKMMKRRE